MNYAQIDTSYCFRSCKFPLPLEAPTMISRTWTAICMLSLLLVAATIFSLNLEPKKPMTTQEIMAEIGRLQKKLETASLTALTVSQGKDLEVGTAHKGQEQVPIASFLIETNPDPETSVDLRSLTIKVEPETGLVLRKLRLEFDLTEYESQMSPNDTHLFTRPSYIRRQFGGGMKLYATIYATIDKSSREGTYTIPLRLTGWNAQNRGMDIPFPGVVNGQPLVVMP